VRVGVLVIMFSHEHTDARVIARPGAYRDGDVVAVFNGIPQGRKELSGLIGEKAANSTKFSAFGITDADISDPEIQALLETQYEIDSVTPEMEVILKPTRVRKKGLDYKSAPSELKGRMTGRTRIGSTSKSEIAALVRNNP